MVKIGSPAIDKHKADDGRCEFFCLKGMKQFDQSMSHWDWSFDFSAQYSLRVSQNVCVDRSCFDMFLDIRPDYANWPFGLLRRVELERWQVWQFDARLVTNSFILKKGMRFQTHRRLPHWNPQRSITSNKFEVSFELETKSMIIGLDLSPNFLLELVSVSCG